MEKSLKRVEKLVEETNAALTQMRYSLEFDDLMGEEPGLKGGREHTSNFGEMLTKVKGLLASNEFSSIRKTSEVRDKIKELNRKMENLSLEKEKSKITEISLRKCSSLTKDEEVLRDSGGGSTREPGSPRTAVKGGVELEAQLGPRRKSGSALTLPNPIKSREELNSKILETREIVDRGFQTARRLTQRVESLTVNCEKKSPCFEKKENEIDLKNSEESHSTANNESKKNRLRRCCKHSRKTQKKTEKENNNVVVDIRRGEMPMRKYSYLKLQRLPSVHIRDGLQLQKIHSFEILPKKVNQAPSNTAVNVISHDDIEREKTEKLLEEAKKKFACGNATSGSYVECFNCGELIRLQDNKVDPKKLENVLLQCNFNVFDPRIDEFIEKHPLAATPEESTEVPAKRVRPKHATPERTFKIQHLSEQLSRKYKREADTLEEGHLKFDNILQDLFKKVDESRGAFENCRILFKKGRNQKLTVSKTVLVSFEGDKSRQKKHLKSNKKGRKSIISEWKQEKRGYSPGERKTESVQTVNEIVRLTEEYERVSTPGNSDNDYESDFEGESGSVDDKRTAVDDSLTKNLSTITEVDSELEKKLSENTSFQNLTPGVKESPGRAEEAEDVSRKTCESAPATAYPLGIKSEEKQSIASVEGSEKKIKNESKTYSSQRSNPTELVTSLTDVLSALRNQFARTESLAEKLTENVKSQKREVGSCQLADNLRCLPGSSEPDDSLNSLHSKSSTGSAEKTAKSVEKREASIETSSTEEGPSSVGEVVVGGRHKSGSNSLSECTLEELTTEERSSGNAGKELQILRLGLNNEDVSYSEGEIRSFILLSSESGSVRSVGEVLSEKGSGGSTLR